MTSTPATYDDLSCQELVELVTDYFEGAMPDELRLRFERHIERCTGCRAYVEEMRQTIRATGSVTVGAVTPEAERALLEAFRGFRR
jgi:anti-sigma factor RsiW